MHPNLFINQKCNDMSSSLLAVGNVLQRWREQHGFTIWQIAKFEGGMRTEPLTRIERGESVQSHNLMNYLDFVWSHDPDFDFLNQWANECGYTPIKKEVGNGKE